jgi:multidrug transporter EmrE-like cation transporter
VAAILAAPFLIALAARVEPAVGFLMLPLLVYLAAVSAVYVVLVLMLRSSARGLALGGLAGAFGGFVVLFQKASTSPSGRALLLADAVNGAMVDRAGMPPVFSECGMAVRLMEFLTNPFAIAWILLSILSALVVQFSYRHVESFRVVPVFDANNILISVLGGLVAFQSRLQALQWCGVVIIYGTMCVLALRPPGGNANVSACEE